MYLQCVNNMHTKKKYKYRIQSTTYKNQLKAKNIYLKSPNNSLNAYYIFEYNLLNFLFKNW